MVRAQEQRPALPGKPRQQESISQCPPGPASVSWTSKQPWEGRSSQLSTETSLRAERAFGLVEVELALEFRKESAWRANVRSPEHAVMFYLRTREGTRACLGEDPWAGLRP